MIVKEFVRNHRTALVIDVSNGVTPEYRERYNRLLESVNGNNIKVDVFTLSTDGVLRPGRPEDVPNDGDEYKDLNQWAKGAGYSQLLPVQSTGR